LSPSAGRPWRRTAHSRERSPRRPSSTTTRRPRRETGREAGRAAGVRPTRNLLIQNLRKITAPQTQPHPPVCLVRLQCKPPPPRRRSRPRRHPPLQPGAGAHPPARRAPPPRRRLRASHPRLARHPSRARSLRRARSLSQRADARVSRWSAAQFRSRTANTWEPLLFQGGCCSISGEVLLYFRGGAALLGPGSAGSRRRRT